MREIYWCLAMLATALLVILTSYPPLLLLVPAGIMTEALLRGWYQNSLAVAIAIVGVLQVYITYFMGA